MRRTRPFSQVIDSLRGAGLRPTRQRLALARLLFDGGQRHVTAEILHGEAVDADIKVSLATVYNTLHDFCEKKLLKKVNVDAEKVYFDTNTNPHHHFYSDSEKLLIDISKDKIKIQGLPKAPKGKKIKDVELIAHLIDN